MAYHTQADGQSERTNQVVKTMIHYLVISIFSILHKLSSAYCCPVANPNNSYNTHAQHV